MGKKKSAFVGTLVLFAIIIAGILLLYIVCPIHNDNVAKGITKELKSIPLPENAVLIDDFSMAGKLCGNGNGMQYFGAILIKSDLPEEEIADYYKQYSSGEYDALVKKQESSIISEIIHRHAAFDAELDGDGYYMIYTWGDYNGFSSEFDLRGH
ncbi:hypothetical protein [Butyrivibrio proteoclasticus]|uniref:hypothetical protein n=1 Tax=Butyrivibrio proteoclasticus TaxID=43305 RepID=UPI00047BE507|nr:hypothetical protein [Butyrivibrio proteoclasticus]